MGIGVRVIGLATGVFGRVNDREILAANIQRNISNIKGLSIDPNQINVEILGFMMSIANLAPGACDLYVEIDGIRTLTKLTDEMHQRIRKRVRGVVSRFIENYRYARPKTITVLVG